MKERYPRQNGTIVVCWLAVVFLFRFFFTCGVADVQDGFQVTVAQVVVLAASDDKRVVERSGVVTHDRVLGWIQHRLVQASMLSIANARNGPNKHKESQPHTHRPNKYGGGEV